MKFLVDECLSPELTKLAHAKGYGESSHVVWLGRAGMKDWELKPIILDGDWTFVTKNSVDFRGRAHWGACAPCRITTSGWPVAVQELGASHARW